MYRMVLLWRAQEEQKRGVEWAGLESLSGGKQTSVAWKGQGWSPCQEGSRRVWHGNARVAATVWSEPDACGDEATGETPLSGGSYTHGTAKAVVESTSGGTHTRVASELEFPMPQR